MTPGRTPSVSILGHWGLESRQAGAWETFPYPCQVHQCCLGRGPGAMDPAWPRCLVLSDNAADESQRRLRSGYSPDPQFPTFLAVPLGLWPGDTEPRSLQK